MLPEHMTPAELIRLGFEYPPESLAHRLALLAETLIETAKHTEHTADRTIANLEAQLYDAERQIEHLEGKL